MVRKVAVELAMGRYLSKNTYEIYLMYLPSLSR